MVLLHVPGQLTTVPSLTVDEVNGLDEAEFLAVLGHVFEDSPELALSARAAAPFADRAALVAAFQATASQLDEDAVLALLRAHPQLGATKPMAAASVEEQRGAGLSAIEDERRAELAAGNAAYLERFGFPFIIAVRGLTPDDIAAALAERLGHDASEERRTAFEQVQRIAELRIVQAVAP